MAESRTTNRRNLSDTFSTPAEQPTRAEAAASTSPAPLAQAVAELVGTFALIYVGVMVLVQLAVCVVFGRSQSVRA